MYKCDPKPALKLLELRAHLNPQERVERRQRLVEKQYFWLCDERASERHPLLLAARQLVGIMLHPVAEPEPVNDDPCSRNDTLS